MVKTKMLALGIVMLGLVACGDKYSSVRVRDTKGVEHECIVYHRGYKGGISCDWGNH